MVIVQFICKNLGLESRDNGIDVHSKTYRPSSREIDISITLEKYFDVCLSVESTVPLMPDRERHRGPQNHVCARVHVLGRLPAQYNTMPGVLCLRPVNSQLDRQTTTIFPGSLAQMPPTVFLLQVPHNIIGNAYHRDIEARRLVLAPTMESPQAVKPSGNSILGIKLDDATGVELMSLSVLKRQILTPMVKAWTP